MADTEVTLRKYTGAAGKAIDLLGAGIQASIVASTLGVTDAYISQLLSDDEFKEQVVTLRYKNLAKHNERDDALDSLEDKIISHLDKVLPLAAMDPMKLGKLLGVVNSAKRRGAASPESISGQTQVVQLVLPNAIMQKFSVVKNSDNMVIEAGDQKLIAATSMNLMKRMEARKNTPEVTDVTPKIEITPSDSHK